MHLPARSCRALSVNARYGPQLTLQEKKKDDLVAKAFEKSSKESKKDKREARFDEIKALFGIGVATSSSGGAGRGR